MKCLVVFIGFMVCEEFGLMLILNILNVLIVMIVKLWVLDGVLFYVVVGVSYDCGVIFFKVGGLVFILYQCDDCYLCDQVLVVLVQVWVGDLDSVFIDDDVVLEVCYGLCVLVLCDVQGCELDWLFDVVVLWVWMG